MSETATWAEEQKIHLLVVQSLVPSRPMFLGGLLSAMADRLAILALAGRPYAYVHGSYARRKISRRLLRHSSRLVLSHIMSAATTYVYEKCQGRTNVQTSI